MLLCWFPSKNGLKWGLRFHKNTKVMFWYNNYTVMPLLIHSTYISTHLLPRQNIGPALHMDIQHSFIDKWENNRNKYIPIIISLQKVGSYFSADLIWKVRVNSGRLWHWSPPTAITSKSPEVPPSLRIPASSAQLLTGPTRSNPTLYWLYVSSLDRWI